MRQSTFLLLSAASSGIAAPIVEKTADFDAPAGGDITILNYALTLEFLERKFYEEGLANYTAKDFTEAGLPRDVYNNLKTIYSDEKSHVDFLSGALGAAAVHEASYAFPSTDAASFLSLASVLEGVGVSAYLGAAAAIANKAYVPVAGSILTVEARHSAYLRHALQKKVTSFAPRPYDTPIDFNQAFSLAAQFITAFAPGDPALPFSAFPPLTVVPEHTPQVAGRTALVFSGAADAAVKAGLVTPEEKVYAVFYSGLDVCYAQLESCDGNYELTSIPGANCSATVTLPPTGQVYVVLSTANGTIAANDENTISGVGILEVVAE